MRVSESSSYSSSGMFSPLLPVMGDSKSRSDGLAERWEASQRVESSKCKSYDLSSSERYSDLTNDSSLVVQAIELSVPRGRLGVIGMRICKMVRQESGRGGSVVPLCSWLEELKTTYRGAERDERDQTRQSLQAFLSLSGGPSVYSFLKDKLAWKSQLEPSV
ncbi:hypothetical protein RHSIM_Rhsim10G0061600 [Rhododendron simsii]|uniref:Uncharacterized protein n=1 Tax=Rhododendron simsii TaxID=118357 RepID=A0A834LC47_RHOSS|nr:hypothetical protein RHSIM_Rhsim10G0061600 [Rhododendron simsii]